MALGTYNPKDNNGLYNPINTNKRQRGFDIVFINFRFLVGNHEKKEIDLIFAGCGYSDAIKLNRSWQLDLLDFKPVYILEAIALAAALFYNAIFMFSSYQTM